MDKDKLNILHNALLNPARNECESYEEYKIRLKFIQKKLKEYLRGKS